MANRLSQIWNAGDITQKFFAVFALITLLSAFAAIASELYFLAGIPVALLLAYLVVVDFRLIFFFLLACIPLSTEVALPNGFGTDLPTEPLMVGLMLIYIIYLISKGKELKSNFVRHPISLLVLIHLGWILVTTVTSGLFLVSLKFFLAKTWYILCFYFLAGHILKTEKEVKKLFWFVFIPLMFTVIVTMIRHAAFGFSFQDVHQVLHPFQRNHVNYAATLSLFFPIILLASQWYPWRSFTWWILVGALFILFIAIYLSYTRAAYVSLLLALATYFIIKLKLIRYVLALALVGAICGVIYMVSQNTYLEYAPNYDRTVTHTDFDNLLEATYKMEDISTMERVYRWVAGLHMTQDNPLLGFGPGNFVNFYKPYTVTSFQTYVSDNEEQSGIHSYFIMTLVEQGIFGLILFIALSFFVLIRGEVIYHECRNPKRRRIILMAILCTVVIDAFLIINDMIETDKVGSFFFIMMAILVNMDLENTKENNTSTPLPKPT